RHPAGTAFQQEPLTSRTCHPVGLEGDGESPEAGSATEHRERVVDPQAERRSDGRVGYTPPRPTHRPWECLTTSSLMNIATSDTRTTHPCASERRRGGLCPRCTMPCLIRVKRSNSAAVSTCVSRSRSFQSRLNPTKEAARTMACGP